jgi:hypothetical protein
MAKKVTVTMEFLVNDNPEFELEKLNRLDMASEIVDWAEDERRGIAQFGSVCITAIEMENVEE